MEATMVIPPPRFATRVGERQPGRPWTWPITIALHLLGAAAIVVLPLLAEEPLPDEASGSTRAFFVAPVLAAPPPPPPPAPRAERAPRAAAPSEAATAFTAPFDVPDAVSPESSLDLGIEGGVPGGVEGGVPGGVVGGVVGGLPTEAPPPPVALVRVGGLIREPKKIRDVPPVYPSIAREARIQGVVILEATITPQGRVEGVKVLRGIPALDEAAVEAVRQWTYTPTLLGGVPVGVVMTVTVNFVLRAGVVN